MVTTLDLSQMEFMVQEQLELQKNILLARNYYDGIQTVVLSARAMEFLGMHKENTFKLNVCRTIVTAVSNELNLIGFDTNEKVKEGEVKVKKQAQWAAEIFDKNKLASLQDSVHEFALSDCETFVIVEWDGEEKFPRMIHNQRFIDTEVGGDGMGVWMVYENGDPNQKPLYAVKQWIETEFSNGTPVSNTRRTVYFPDRIERWVFKNGIWEHFEEEGKEWPIPWKDKQGEPLGIPVFHFKNKSLNAEHWDAIPMQDAINKTLVDILAAGDLTAFKSFFGIGFYPTIDGKEPNADGSNVMKMGPGQFNGTMNAPGEAEFHEVEGADVTPMVNTLTQLILITAQITDTPVSRFITTAAIASADTIKAQESQLKKKAIDRRDLFSTPWSGAMAMGRKLQNLYTTDGFDEAVQFISLWKNSESLDELAQKRETLGIPQEQLWLEAGYTADQISIMKATPEYRVKYEAELWEGATAATQNIPLETYLRRAGVPEEEIKQILKDIENQSGVPTTDL